MNVKRFTGRTSREAMQKVKQVFGDDAVVLSTKPAPEGGVEIMAMGADSIAAIENLPAERHEPEEPAPAPARQAAKRFSDIVRLCSMIFKTPLCFVSLLDDEQAQPLPRTSASADADGTAEPQPDNSAFLSWCAAAHACMTPCSMHDMMQHA